MTTAETEGRIASHEYPLDGLLGLDTLGHLDSRVANLIKEPWTIDHADPVVTTMTDDGKPDHKILPFDEVCQPVTWI